MSDASSRLYDEALDLLRRAVGPGAQFRPHQWEAIEVGGGGAQPHPGGPAHRVGQEYRLLRLDAPAARRRERATVIISPLLSLMRNQLEMAGRIGIHAVSINSTNADEWGSIEAMLRDARMRRPAGLSRSAYQPALPRAGAPLPSTRASACSWWTRPTASPTGATTSAPTTGASCVSSGPSFQRPGHRHHRHRQRPCGGGRGRTAGRRPSELRGPLDRGLALQVVRLPARAQRLAWLAARLPTLPGTGMVYCLTVREAERVGAWLGSRASSPHLHRRLRRPRGSTSSTGSAKARSRWWWPPRPRHGLRQPRMSGSSSTSSRPGHPSRTTSRWAGRPSRRRAYGVLLTGAEDAEIHDYFIRTAFPAPDAVEAVRQPSPSPTGLPGRSWRGWSTCPWGRIENMLKVLEVEGRRTVKAALVPRGPALGVPAGAGRRSHPAASTRAAGHGRVRHHGRVSPPLPSPPT